jgi:hypothetical protein
MTRVAIGVLLSLASFVPATAANPVQIENAKPGASDWKLTSTGYTSGVIEGYASLTAVNRGGQIKIFVNTKEPTYTMDVYRMGYYQGLGARRMMPTISRTGTPQPACPMDAITGLIECNWFNPYALNIPNSPDPTDWMSGIYIVKLTSGTTKTQQYITFTVRDDARFTDLLVQQAVATYQAYNRWGGKSLYGTLANPGDTANKAMKVSFDRPYYGEDGFGVGQLFNAVYTGWELGMLQWLEKEGYDVSYATSVDVDANANLLLNHKAFLAVGHDEYWSWKMRDNLQNARDAGVNLGFFSGNTSYWQIRFESSVISNQPGRVVVGYKESWQNDPITPSYLKTNNFRYAPVNRPEDQLIGVMFVTSSRPAFCVEDASHWVFTGTGVKNGDCLTNPDGSPFLGYEVDSMIGPGSPANTQRMAHSPVNAQGTDYSDMTMYRASSGATVVAIGSIGWSQTVPQIQQVTRNVLARFITNAFGDTVPLRPLLPQPFTSQDIGDTGRAGFVAVAGADSFTLNGAGQDSWSGNDALYYAYQPFTGDGQIVTRLTGLRLYWDNRAGVMIRESLAPNAKYVALLSRPSGSIGVVKEGVEFWTKDTVGANHKTLAAKDQAMPNWLKLARVGSVFNSYVSADGLSWTLVGTATVPMNGNVYIGTAVQSSQRAVWATAKFDNVSVSHLATPILTSITVTPANPSIVFGANQSFVAQGYDQFLNPIAASFSWSSSNTNIGTINAVSGTFSAAASGTTNVLVTSGNVTASTTVTVTGTSGTLPTPWLSVGVGAVNPAGSAGFTSGVFTIQGSGSDVWGTQDAFQYVYQSLPADGEMVVRVTSVQNTNANAKAGIMLRASLASDSPHVILDLKPSSEIEFMTRATPSGITAWFSGANQPMPAWLKLVRTGSTVTGFSSADALTWNRVGVATVTFPSPAYIGMLVVSHASGVLNTSTFDGVAVVTSPGTAGTCSSVTVIKPVLWSGHYESNWSITVTPENATCTWKASVDQPWMGLNPIGASAGAASLTGTGTTTFSMRVLTNNSNPPVWRSGNFAVGSQVFPVTQEP